MFENLRGGHPRLLALEEDLERVRTLVGVDERARALRDRLHAAALRLLDEPAVEFKLVGRGGYADRSLDKVWVLLPVSRLCLERIYTLALVYRLEGDERFARRAAGEMLAAAAFPDWNPAHFLDTAEMTHALGIGYDWLYHCLDGETRSTVRRAIAAKGLAAGVAAYREEHHFAMRGTNWNQVCNGGLGIGALAVADEEPELAEQVLARALASIRRAMETYAPDGGWDEGILYWHYGTRYLVYFLQSLETALGEDFGLAGMPGFDRSGDFRIHTVGPLGKTFNYGDGYEEAGGAPEMFWLARRFHKPHFARHQLQWLDDHHLDPKGLPRNEGALAQDLLWFEAKGGEAPELPLDALFRKIEVACFRSGWDDGNAIFVGFKGGEGGVSHGHMDLGSFVLDALGWRWALDLGMEEYEIRDFLLHSGRVKERWEIYRLGTRSHNTLVIGNTFQNPTARTTILRFASTPRDAFAIADLTEAYQNARRVWRGVALLQRRQVLVQDEVHMDASADVHWGMLTEAEIETEGREATLVQGDARLQARIVEPEGGFFEVEGCDPPEPQKQQPGVRRLALRLHQMKRGRIVILFTPYRKGEVVPGTVPEVAPLMLWR